MSLNGKWELKRSTCYGNGQELNSYRLRPWMQEELKKIILKKVFDQKETAIYILGSSAMLRCCPKAGALLGQGGEGLGGTVKSE